MLASIYTAAALSLLLIALSLNISRLRLRYRISFGDGGNAALTAAMRAHGNSLEQSLPFIILLYFAQTTGQATHTLVALLGGAFVVVRVLYCVGVLGRLLLLRQVSHGLTMLLLLAVTLLLLA
ncbi:MAPEG family protein [Aquipseudomonas campi]